MNSDSSKDIKIEQSGKTTILQDEDRDNENHGEHTDTSGVPVDRGWAWMILLGSMLQMTLIVGLQKASGIIFVAFQQRFNSTSSMTSLLSTVQNAAYSLSAPIVMTIGLKMTSFRSMMFIGNVLITLSYVITAFANQIQMLLLSYGVLQGIGMAFTVPPGVSILGIYFKKKRGLANSVAVSGASIGGFILAPLITYLLQKYGYQGCMLLIGAILLNGCISGALFRSQSFYQRKATDYDIKQSVLKLHPRNCNSAKSWTSTVIPKDVEALFPQMNIRKGPKVNELEKECLFRSLPEIPHHEQILRPRTFTNTSHMGKWIRIGGGSDHIYNSFEYMRSSALDMTNDNTKGTLKDGANSQRKNRCAELLRTLVKSFDFTLFKNTLFIGLLFIGFNICASSLLAAIFLAPYAYDINIGSDGIATIVTVFSAVDLISRILLGMISDKGWLQPATIVGIASIVDGVAAQFLFLCSSFSSLMVYTVILGVFSGSYFALFPVVIVDFLTLQKLNSALGFLALSNGAGISMTFYFMGYIRDGTNSYIASYHVIGTMSLIGGILLVLLPIFKKCNEHTNDGQSTPTKT